MPVADQWPQLRRVWRGLEVAAVPAHSRLSHASRLFQDDELAYESRYAADVMESALGGLTQLPGASEEELHAGLADLRDLQNVPRARLGWVVHKSTGRR